MINDKIKHKIELLAPAGLPRQSQMNTNNCSKSNDKR